MPVSLGNMDKTPPRSWRRSGCRYSPVCSAKGEPSVVVARALVDGRGQIGVACVRRFSFASHSVTALARKLVATSGLPPARLYDLRHVHATTLLLAGVPVHVVAARLGHADPAITLRVYAHVLREQAAGVADVFARALEGSPEPLVSKSVNKTGSSAADGGLASR